MAIFAEAVFYHNPLPRGKQKTFAKKFGLCLFCAQLQHHSKKGVVPVESTAGEWRADKTGTRSVL
jgi:hypothetical protein